MRDWLRCPHLWSSVCSTEHKPGLIHVACASVAGRLHCWHMLTGARLCRFQFPHREGRLAHDLGVFAVYSWSGPAKFRHFSRMGPGTAVMAPKLARMREGHLGLLMDVAEARRRRAARSNRHMFCAIRHEMLSMRINLLRSTKPLRRQRRVR